MSMKVTEVSKRGSTSKIKIKQKKKNKNKNQRSEENLLHLSMCISLKTKADLLVVW